MIKIIKEKDGLELSRILNEEWNNLSKKGYNPGNVKIVATPDCVVATFNYTEEENFFNGMYYEEKKFLCAIDTPMSISSITEDLVNDYINTAVEEGYEVSKPYITYENNVFLVFVVAGKVNKITEDVDSDEKDDPWDKFFI